MLYAQILNSAHCIFLPNTGKYAEYLLSMLCNSVTLVSQSFQFTYNLKFCFQFLIAPARCLFPPPWQLFHLLLPLQMHGDTVQNQLVVQCVEIPLYLTLYSPAIDWILQCIAYRAPEVNDIVTM